MKKKYIVITTILIASIATLGFITISNKKANKNITSSYHNTDLKETNENDKNLDVKDISTLKEGIDIAGLNIKIDSTTLSRSFLHYTYTITGLKNSNTFIELICEPVDDINGVPGGLGYNIFDDGNTMKGAGQSKFIRSTKGYKDFKFKLKFYDSTREVPGVYRVTLDESTNLNKVIEMDSRKFYFDEISETVHSYRIKFYISGYKDDSLETQSLFANRYSIDQQYGDAFRFSGGYSHDLSFENFKYEVNPAKCAITPDGYLTKEEIQMNQDIFENEDRIHQFEFFVSKHEMKEKNYPKPIKLFLRSSMSNTSEFIGEFNE